MPQSNRMQKVAGLVQATLADILLKESEDERFQMVTITSVILARDMSSARVYVSVWDESQAKELVKALNVASRYFRHRLAQSKIEMRVMPELKFFYDDSALRGSRIDALLHTAMKKPTSSDD